MHADAAVQKGIGTGPAGMERLIKKEKATEADKAAALARIHGSTAYDDLKAPYRHRGRHREP